MHLAFRDSNLLKIAKTRRRNQECNKPRGHVFASTINCNRSYFWLIGMIMQFYCWRDIYVDIGAGVEAGLWSGGEGGGATTRLDIARVLYWISQISHSYPIFCFFMIHFPTGIFSHIFQNNILCLLLLFYWPRRLDWKIVHVIGDGGNSNRINIAVAIWRRNCQ